MSLLRNSSSCDDKVRTCVENVLNNYAKLETQLLYEELVKLTREERDGLLMNVNGKGNKDKDIKGIVQGRTKKYDSLKKKLDDLRDLEEEPKYKNPEEYDWLKKNLIDLENNPKIDSKGYDLWKKKLIELERDPNEAPTLETGFLTTKTTFTNILKWGTLLGFVLGCTSPTTSLGSRRRLRGTSIGNGSLVRSWVGEMPLGAEIWTLRNT